jgi:hypothetical protein
LVTAPRNERGIDIGRETPLHYLAKRKSELNLG